MPYFDASIALLKEGDIFCNNSFIRIVTEYITKQMLFRLKRLSSKNETTFALPYVLG